VNRDFLDFLSALLQSDARFLVVGAHAMAVHGVPRATGALDVWIDASADNADRVWAALIAFGAPVDTIGLSKANLTAPELVVQLGVVPQRIDLLTSVTGLAFDEAWTTRQRHRVEGLEVPFVGLDALLRKKRATARPKDLVDVEILESQSRGVGRRVDAADVREKKDRL
jgi:hypothetical protein